NTSWPGATPITGRRRRAIGARAISSSTVRWVDRPRGAWRCRLRANDRKRPPERSRERARPERFRVDHDLGVAGGADRGFDGRAAGRLERPLQLAFGELNPPGIAEVPDPQLAVTQTLHCPLGAIDPGQPR